MSDGARAHPLRWLPPLLVGAAAATAAEVAMALLLYDGPGLVRSLTTVLVVLASALAMGLWTGPASGGAVEALRRRWLLCMVAFLVATLYSASWSVVGRLGGGALGQGVGLAALGALPLYAAGSVLAGIGAVDRESPMIPRTLGGPVALGAALGFLATGLALPRSVTPASLLLTCLVLLSAGGLVYGAVLDRTLRVVVRARRSSRLGEVRVEDRHHAGAGVELRLLLEDGWIRAWRVLDGDEPPSWESTVWDAVGPAPRVLVVGGGASTLPRRVARVDPGVEVEVLERNPRVVELGAEFFDTGLAPDPERDGAAAGEEALPDLGERVRVRVGNPEDLLTGAEGVYDLVLVDLRALRALGGLEGLTRAGREALAARVAPEGVLALGPVTHPDAGARTPDGWHVRRLGAEPSGVAEVLLDGDVPTEGILLASRASFDPPAEPVSDPEPEGASLAGDGA